MTTVEHQGIVEGLVVGRVNCSRAQASRVIKPQPALRVGMAGSIFVVFPEGRATSMRLTGRLEGDKRTRLAGDWTF